MSKSKKTAKPSARPSKKIIHEATQRYANLMPANGAAQWFDQCFERTVKLAKDSKIGDVRQCIKIKLATSLTRGVFDFGLAKEPIDVCLAVSTILGGFSEKMAEAA